MLCTIIYPRPIWFWSILGVFGQSYLISSMPISTWIVEGNPKKLRKRNFGSHGLRSGNFLATFFRILFLSNLSAKTLCNYVASSEKSRNAKTSWAIFIWHYFGTESIYVVWYSPLSSCIFFKYLASSSSSVTCPCQQEYMIWVGSQPKKPPHDNFYEPYLTEEGFFGQVYYNTLFKFFKCNNAVYVCSVIAKI